MLEHLHQPHHGHVGRIDQGLDPCLAHAGAADAEKTQQRVQLERFPDQVGAVDVSGGFARHDHDSTLCLHADKGIGVSPSPRRKFISACVASSPLPCSPRAHNG